jgi:hypothetical protein
MAVALGEGDDSVMSGSQRCDGDVPGIHRVMLAKGCRWAHSLITQAEDLDNLGTNDASVQRVR